MGIKEFYYRLEDRYYEALDKLQESVPVYSIIEPIDSVVPSFAVLLGLVFLLLAGGIFFAFTATQAPGQATLDILVKNSGGKALENAKVLVTGTLLAAQLEGTTDKTGHASITVPFGAEVAVKAQKRSYSDKTMQLSATVQSVFVEMVLENEPIPPTPYTISFAGPTGAKLVSQSISASFACSNSGVAVLQADQSTDSGEITLTPPTGCGLLTIRATSQGYVELDGVIDLPAKVLTFEALPVPKGEILFLIKDAQSGSSINGIKVSLFDAENAPKSTPRFSDAGEVAFSIEPGDYRAMMEDESGAYPSAQQNFSIAADTSQTKNISLAKNPLAIIKISVKDKATGLRVDSAKVVLKNPKGDAFGEREISIQAQQAIFSVSQKGKYSFIASHPDYLPATEEQIDLSNAAPNSLAEKTALLEKCSPQTCGVLKVRVVDEEGKPVENAAVYLNDAPTQSIALEFPQKATDANGYTTPYTNVGAREFFATAQKYPAQGKSGKILIDTLKENNLTVKMEIGKGRLDIEALDQQNVPVPFATAQIIQGSGALLATVSLDAQGKGTFETKADKQVYVVVSKDGYTNYSTVLYQVFKNGSTKISAQLAQQLSNTEAEVKYIGVFDKKGTQIPDNLTAGGSYIVKLQLLVPKNYKETGLHFRAGKEQSAGSDKIFIKSFNAPGTASILSPSFSPPTGQQADMANAANSEAKWANVVWANPQPGIFDAEFEVVVRANASHGSELPIMYRAWGVDSTGQYQRNPLDTALGTAKETASKQELFAGVFTQFFVEGAQKKCDESFCYSERVFDPKEGLVLSKSPYQIRVFDDYNVSFEITNNSGTLHDNSDLRVKNTADGGATTDDTISIENYLITNANSVSFNSSGAVFEIEHSLDNGYFAPNRTIKGEMAVQAKKAANSDIELKIVSGTPQGMEVFNKKISFAPINGQQVDLNVLPEVLAAFSPIDLTAKVTYSGGHDDGRGVGGANVIVTRIDASFNETAQQAVTDEQGNVLFKICEGVGCSPGTKIVVEVEKAGIAPVRVEKEITNFVAEFAPDHLEFNLDLTDNKTEQLAVQIKNLIPSTLKVKRILLRGSFDGVLDVDRMAAYLQQFAGRVEIESGQAKSVTVLAALNDSAQLLEESVAPTGSILIELQDSRLGNVWSPKEIPLKVNVNLSQPPKDPKCVTVSINEWKDSALETSVQKEFSITNNCVSASGSGLDLKNLQATIDWSGGEITGQVMLTVSNLSTGESVSQVLSGGVFTNFFASVPAGQEFLAMLTFVPKPSKVGKQANFNVKIDAEQLTLGGKQTVGSSNDIAANLFIVNLSKCIKGDPSLNQVLELTDKGSATFSLTTEECGAIPIDIRLCYGDSGCTGGAKEGSISVSPKEFSNLVAESVSVSVKRENLAGIYGVKIEARPRGGGWREVGEELVSISPDKGTAFDLSKYDFVIIGSGSKDSATLTNTQLSENVMVDASQCDWGTAQKAKTFSGAGAGVGAAAGALLGATAAIQAANSATQAAAAAKIGTLVPSTKQLDTALASTQKAADGITKTQEQITNTHKTLESGEIQIAVGDCEPGLVGLIPTSTIDSIKNGAKGAAQSMNAGKDILGKTQTELQGTISKLNTAGNNFGAGAAADATKNFGQIIGSTVANLTKDTTTTLTNISTSLTTEKTELEALATALKAEATARTAEFDATGAVKCTAAASLVQGYIASDIPTMTKAVTDSQNLLKIAGTDIQGAANYMNNASSQLSGLAKNLKPSETLQDGKPLPNTNTGGFNTGRFLAIEGMFGGLGAVAGGLVPGLMKSDPCDQRSQFNLSDWKINLKEDAKGINLGKDGIGASWSTKEAFTFGEWEKQQVGVLFENKGIADPKPVYAAAEFSATKHIHANPTIIKKGTKDFGQFNVPDSSTETYSQKFHLRFKTAETEQPLPDISSGTASCVSGVNLGLSGEGAVPNILFNWNWKQFSLGGCDAKTPNSIFCDATQFNFEINYRLDALNEFIDKNRPKLSCPINPGDSIANALAGDIPQQIASGALPATALEGKVSLVAHTYSASKDTISVNAVVGNSSADPQGATVVVTITPPDGVDVGGTKTCTIEFTGIPANQTKSSGCEAKGLKESAGDYSVKVELTNATTDFDQSSSEFSASVQPVTSCWIPTSTELFDGRPAIDYYIDKIEPQISWTQRIPDRQALTDLLVFNAKLVKDGYSQDFLDDFVKYSDETQFFDAPSFFNRFATGRDGKQFGFDAYYKEKSIVFRKKYVDGDAELSRGGIYRIELLVKWGGDWEFFDSSGKPLSTVEVLMQLVSEPQQNSPFYQLPFDGLVGLVGENSLERQGYGLSYTPRKPQDVLALNNSPPIAKTFSSASSNALVNAGIEFDDDLFALNTNPLTRGTILSIDNTGTQAAIKFYPSVATPVLMKMHSDKTDNPFGAFYGIIENDNRINVGETLSYWSGAGACLDFSGTAVTDAFDDSPDRTAQPEDGIQNFENNYTISWSDAARGGDVFLKTIFFTNPQKLSNLAVEEPRGKLSFLTPDEGPKESVALNGINSMEFDNGAKTLGAIQDVFDMVKAAQLCTTSTGSKVTFWWNPKQVYEQEGNAACTNCTGQRSIAKEEQALRASKTCIGTS